MDKYTEDTKKWLDNRFQVVTEDGVFFAHQNIYGFKSSYVENGILLRYVIVYNVIRALSMLEFNSVLDVGGAEGYMPALIRKIFKPHHVRSCDLSETACQRAREIYSIDADPVDGISLPYDNESYDVVLSSETLEHIPDYEKAFNEMLRVARKALIVTVPHEDQLTIDNNIRQKLPHAHIHAFDINSFKNLVPHSFGMKSWGLYSTLLRIPYLLAEGRKKENFGKYGRLKRFVNPLLLITGRILNKNTFKLLLKMDGLLCGKTGKYSQLLFIITKNPSYCLFDKPPGVSIDSILDFTVPLHYIKQPI